MDTNIKFEDIPAKKVSLKSIQTKLSNFTSKLEATKDPKEALAIIRGLEKYMDKFANNATVISIRYSLNTNDAYIAKLQDQMDELSPYVSAAINKFNKILVAHPCRKELEAKLTPYYFVMIENSLKAFDEKIIPELIEINKLSSQYDKVMGGAKIEFRGEIYNMPQMGKFTKSKDRDTRREASIAVDKFLQEKEQEIDNELCNVCNDGDYDDDNLIVYCSSCGILVHQKCYGITVVPKNDWICDSCKFYGNPEKSKALKCILCSQIGNENKKSASEKTEIINKDSTNETHSSPIIFFTSSTLFSSIIVLVFLSSS